jgi:hypothetical protein
MGRIRFMACGAVAALATVVPFWVVPQRRPQPEFGGIEGVVRRAEALGLPGRHTHGPASVTLSVRPLTADQANGLHLGLPPQTWAGKVRVYQRSVRTSSGVDLESYPGLARAEVGSVLIIGDPEVVQMLLDGQAPAPQRPRRRRMVPTATARGESPGRRAGNGRRRGTRR